MMIILGQIPEKTKKRDISYFFSTALKRGLFQKPGKINQIQLPYIKHERTKLLTYYGIVNIEPREAALRAIKKCNRKYFNGRYITVREYVDRSELNDRRTNTQDWDKFDRSQRIADRREGGLKTRDLDMSFGS